MAPKGTPPGYSPHTQRWGEPARRAGVASVEQRNAASMAAGTAAAPGVLAAAAMAEPEQTLASEGGMAGMNASVARGLGRVTWPGQVGTPEPAALVAGLGS